MYGSYRAGGGRLVLTERSSCGRVGPERSDWFCAGQLV